MLPLHTARLIIRRFTEADAAALFEYLHQPTATCFFSMAVADLAAARAVACKRAEGEGYLAVCLADSGTLIGELFAEPELGLENTTVSIGWQLNPRFAGHGYALEAAAALVNHLFTVCNARRLYAYAEDTNQPSRRLCEKLGMRLEGLFLEYVTFYNDEQGEPVYENTTQYALLRHEWLAQQAQSAPGHRLAGGEPE